MGKTGAGKTGTFRHSRFAEKATGAAIVLVVGTWVLFDRGSWPEVYTFALSAGTKSGLQVPVHLDDDVMIVMRTGRVLLETGIPSFNINDVAQPSTSYLLPYIAAFLLFCFPPNVAVMAIAILGFLAVLVTLTTIVLAARSTIFGAAIAVLLVVTSTSTTFALQGWDHLFQGMFLVLATALVVTMNRPFSANRLLIVSAMLTLGTLTRLDSILIAVALIVTVFMIDGSARRVAIFLALPFAVLIGAALAVNYGQFGHLTPTTARLKLGTSPSLGYSLDYILDNGLFSFSAATLLFLLIVLYLASLKALGLRHLLPLTVGASATAGMALFNSDAFEGARMYWVPAVVLACGLAVRMPPFISLASNMKFSSGNLVNGSHIPRIAMLTVVVGGFLLLSGAVGGLNRAFVGSGAPASRTAENYELAEWIDANLNPDDGSVGVFWAGTSFHLPRFEIADFLGKGDELIATTTPRYGAPGHNKWDFELTLQKWRPQVIIPTSNVDPSTLENYLKAESDAASRRGDFGFASAFLVDPEVRREYQWCDVVQSSATSGEPLGLLLRNDIATSLENSRNCRSLWPPPTAQHIP